MHAERAGWSPAEIARACSSTDQGLPRIDFVAEAQSCPVCNGPVKTKKSRTRVVMTLEQGAFEAKEVLKQCASQQPGCAGSLGSQALSQIVKPRQRYGYDLIVQVGLARYLRGKQREEIVAELYQQRRIELSTGSISHLCDRFLVYLGRLHEHCAARLREAMQDGYPLHMDTTCDGGKGGLFVCIDGFRQWVLAAGRVSTENESELSPIIKKTVDLFGDPIAVVRDMGEGGANAVKPLRSRGVVDLICHYHFLAAVGTKLMDKQHLQLMQIIRYSSVRSDLRALLRTLRRYRDPGEEQQRFGAGTVRDELLALVLWVLQADGKKEAPFPFALCHLDFVSRCRQSEQLVEQWVSCPRTQPERRAIRHLSGIVNRLERDKRVPAAVRTLNENQTVFNQLRDVLRLSNAELPRGEVRDDHGRLPELELLRLKQIQQALEQYRKQLLQRVSVLQRRLRQPSCPYAIVLKYLDRYGEHLFGHPAVRDEQGAIIQVVERTNNISEHFFGDAKQNLRRRVGRANLSSDLMQQPAQVALAANLRHSDYVRVVCGCIENLPAAFAELDMQSIEHGASLFRNHRDRHLQKIIEKLLEDCRSVPSAKDRGTDDGQTPVPVRGFNHLESGPVEEPATVV
jgi:hypothetical protein